MLCFGTGYSEVPAVRQTRNRLCTPVNTVLKKVSCRFVSLLFGLICLKMGAYPISLEAPAAYGKLKPLGEWVAAIAQTSQQLLSFFYLGNLPALPLKVSAALNAVRVLSVCNVVTDSFLSFGDLVYSSMFYEHRESSDILPLCDSDQTKVIRCTQCKIRL